MVSGNPTSTSISRVDGLSTDPPVLGRHMYVMPISNMFVDSITNNELLSFMDSFFGYNQILIAVDDMTTFRCLSSLGTFEWLVMPFGLKNVGATY